MIRYRNDFAFPMRWDDFYAEDKTAGHPNFTLMTAAEYDNGRDGDEVGYDDGWWNIVVVEPEITEEVARGVIATTIGVPPELIEFC